MLTQKQAIINEVTAVLGSQFVINKTNVRTILTRSQLKTIRNNIYDGIDNGTIRSTKKRMDYALSRYVNSLISNRLTRAPELNGGIKYSAKNKKLHQDMLINNLSQLLNMLPPNSDDYNAVQEQLNQRKQQVISV